MSEATEVDVDAGPAGNPAVRKESRDTFKNRALQLASDKADVFGSVQGQRVFAWLVDEICNFDREVFNENPRRSAFDEGRKAIAMKIRSTAIKTGMHNWHAIEVEVQKRRSQPAGDNRQAKETPNG